MLVQLEELRLHLVQYRQAVDQILSSDLTSPQSWRVCFSEILICTSRLYLDYLLVTKGLPELESLAFKRSNTGLTSTDSGREFELRLKLGKKLDSLAGWPGFVAQNSFSKLTALRTVQDYIDSFSLHLPEIYEETFRVEACTKSFLTNQDSSALAHVSVGLQHLGRNHASFVLQALEWAADEGSWDETPAVSAR